MATSAGHPGRANEDFVGAVVNAVVLVDGAGITGIEGICRHGIAWYDHRLGAAILARLSLAASGTDGNLMAMVAAAIDEVTDAHRDTCNVADSSSPSATVAVVRVADGRADHLVLGDCVLVLDAVDFPAQLVEDRREPDFARPFREGLAALDPGSPDFARLRSQSIAAFRGRRNQPAGFWVAKDDGRVAEHAVIGSPRRPVEDGHAAQQRGQSGGGPVRADGLVPGGSPRAGRTDPPRPRSGAGRWCRRGRRHRSPLAILTG